MLTEYLLGPKNLLSSYSMSPFLLPPVSSYSSYDTTHLGSCLLVTSFWFLCQCLTSFHLDTDHWTTTGFISYTSASPSASLPQDLIQPKAEGTDSLLSMITCSLQVRLSPRSQIASNYPRIFTWLLISLSFLACLLRSLNFSLSVSCQAKSS